ncbi:MAG: class III signal peptide-containing protein [Candidatus Micrarchaeia archaeon]|jgi:uncharacterized protein (UPF0333 family)
MDEKAQGAFEYILMLAGILLIVVVIIMVVKSNILSPATGTVEQTTGQYQQTTNCSDLNASTLQECLNK